jgi:hypothetical protein
MDLKKLRELAEAATPGPWHSTHHGVYSGEDMLTRESVCRVSGTTGWYESEEMNRDFIAAANPAIMIAMAAEIETLRAVLQDIMTEELIPDGYPLLMTRAQAALDGGGA